MAYFQKNSTLTVLSLLLASMMLPADASAATYYNDGSGSLTDAVTWFTDNDGGDGYTMAAGLVPAPGDSGIVESTVTVTETMPTSVDYDLQIFGTVDLTANDINVVSGGLVDVKSGGTLNSNVLSFINIANGGELSVESGGVLSNANAYIDGELNLFNTQSVPSGYQWEIDLNGVVDIAGSGSLSFASGTDLTVDVGGTIVNAGSISFASGSTFTQNNPTWNIDGIINIDNSQSIITNTAWTVLSGADLNITNNGDLLIANNGSLIVDSGGTLYVSSGASLDSGTGTLTINSGGIFNQNGSLNCANLIELNNASQVIVSGSAWQIESGCSLNPSNSTTISINSTGDLTIDSGGIFNLINGAVLNVLSGGAFSPINGWTFDGTVNLSNTHSIANPIDVLSGGNLNILSGGVLTIGGTGLNINLGGTMTIANGATTTVSSGATLYIEGDFVSNANAIFKADAGGIVTSANTASSSNFNTTGYSIAGDTSAAITSYFLSAVTGNNAVNYNMVLSHAPSTWAAFGLPGGLAIDAGTGEITGTPSSAGSGTILINTQGSSASQSLSYSFTTPAPSGGGRSGGGGGGSSIYKFNHDIKFGAKGDTGIKKLQQFLSQNKFQVTVSGSFATSTKLALRKFQKSVGLKETGNLDKVTRAYINKLKLKIISSTKPAIKSTTTIPVAVLKPITKTDPICVAPFGLNKPVKFGAANNANDVNLIKRFLNKFEGLSLVLSGVYGTADYNAVIKWQEKYASEILTPVGLTRGSGYFATASANKMRSLQQAVCK